MQLYINQGLLSYNNIVTRLVVTKQAHIFFTTLSFSISVHILSLIGKYILIELV